jgi:hypothetical protein
MRVPTLDQLSRHVAEMAALAGGVWSVSVFRREDLLYHVMSDNPETIMDLGAVRYAIEGIEQGADVGCLLCGQTVSLSNLQAVVVVRPNYDSLVAAAHVRRPAAITNALCAPCCAADDALKSRVMTYLKDNLFDGEVRAIDFVHRPGRG